MMCLKKAAAIPVQNPLEPQAQLGIMNLLAKNAHSQSGLSSESAARLGIIPCPLTNGGKMSLHTMASQCTAFNGV